MRDFDLVVPAYNEAKGLPVLLSRVQKAAASAGFTPENFRLLVVNNGSTDDTAACLKELQATDMGAWFEVVTVKVNQGYGHGVYTGLKATHARMVGFSHADLQCDPKDAFIACARAMQARVPTLVKGARYGRHWRDQTVSHLFALCAHGLLNMGAKEINAQPKVFEASLLDAMVTPPKTFAFDLYVMYVAKKAGYEIESIPVTFVPRPHGVSHWAASLAGRYRFIFGLVEYMWSLSKEHGRLPREN